MKRAILLVLLAGLCAAAAFAKGGGDSSSSSSSSSSDIRPLTNDESGLHTVNGGNPLNPTQVSIAEREVTVDEVREGIGSTGSTILDDITDENIQAAIDSSDAMSLPNGIIYTTDPENLPLTAHELEHQSQYQNGDKKQVAEQLVTEANEYQEHKKDPSKPNPYETPGKLEYEAQQVQTGANKMVLRRMEAIYE